MRRILTIIILAALPAACSQRIAQTAATGDFRHATSREYDYFFLEAVRLQMAEDYAGAFDLLTYCTALDSLAPEAYYLLGVYYSDLDADSLADACLKRAVNLNPKNDAYHERLARWYLQTSNYAKAVDAYEYLYANNKSRTDVLDLLTRLYLIQKNYDGAISAVSRIEQDEGLGEATTLTKMQAYQAMGKKQKAYEALEELCNAYPNDVNVKLMMGNWLVQNGRSNDARSIFLEAERTDPANENVATSLYDFYRTLGEDSLAQIYRDRILLNRHTSLTTKATMLQAIIRDNERQGGDSAAVLALLNEVIRADTTNVDAAELKAYYMMSKNMPEDSINDALRQVLAADPSREAPRMQLLQSEWRNNNLDAVIALCEPALVYNPDEPVFCYHLGVALYQKNDTLEALRAFRTGTQHLSGADPSLAGDFYLLIGDIEHLAGNIAQAYEAYDSCLSYTPEKAACLNNYAYFLAIDGSDLKKAEEMSRKAINIEPDNATYLDTYAWTLFLEERFSEAKKYIDRTLECADTTENNSTLYDHAGDIYAAVSDIETACKYWREALLLEPDDPAAIEEKLRRYEK